MSNQPSIFVSYRRTDSGSESGRIYDHLTTRFGQDHVFKDVDSIPFGVDFRRHLEDEIAKCDVVIAVIGPTWLTIVDEHGNRRLDDPADWVRLEIEEALKRDIPVIPLLVRGATMPRELELPVSLRALAYRNSALARPDPDFRTDMARLMNSLDGMSYSSRAANLQTRKRPKPSPILSDKTAFFSRISINRRKILAILVAGGSCITLFLLWKAVIGPIFNPVELSVVESSSSPAKKPLETVPSISTPEEPEADDQKTVTLDATPEELEPYIKDLLRLGLLDIFLEQSPDKNSQALFLGAQEITRTLYAKLLFDANNYFYKDQRNKQIRPASKHNQPVFQDLPSSHPYFSEIQGLAEAGIIPSPLTGSSTSLTFRPNAPLTRKDLLLWKVPLDTRQQLPQASAAEVEQSWGFQDTDEIPPRTLQALIADYQNGDFANIRRAFTYTDLFQPNRTVTQAEAAGTVWRFGNSTDGITARELKIE